MIRDILLEVENRMKEKALQNPKREAEELLCELLHFSRSQLYNQQATALSDELQATVWAWVDRRLKGEPLAYIAGQVEFYGCTVEINPSVLIPRPETEILVDKVASTLATQDLAGKTLLDLCCGSGYIGISLKKKFPLLSVYLSDISPEAIDLSKHNGQLNHVEVVCLTGDLLKPFQGKKAHFVICNPPYISEEEYQALDSEVKDFEPERALLAGKSGLEFYERLARELPPFLYPKAKVWLEIGYQQGEAVKKLFDTPPWKNLKVENDWAGHQRFFFLENE